MKQKILTKMGLKIDYITREFIFSDSDIVKIKRINNKLKKEEQRIRNYITQLQEVLKTQIQENIIDGFTIDSCSIFWDSAKNGIHDISFHSTDFLFQAPTIIKFEDAHPLAKEVFSCTFSYLLNSYEYFKWQDMIEMNDISIDFEVEYNFRELIKEEK